MVRSRGGSSTTGGSSRGEASTSNKRKKSSTPPYDEDRFRSWHASELFRKRIDNCDISIEGRIMFDDADESRGPIKELFEYQGWLPFLQDKVESVDPDIVKSFYANLCDTNIPDKYTTYLAGKEYELTPAIIAGLYRTPLPVDGLVVTRYTGKGSGIDVSETDLSLVLHGHPGLFKLTRVPTFIPIVRILHKILRHSVFPKVGENNDIKLWYQVTIFHLLQHNKMSLPKMILKDMMDVCSGHKCDLRFGRLITRFCKKYVTVIPSNEFVSPLSVLAISAKLPASEGFDPLPHLKAGEVPSMAADDVAPMDEGGDDVGGEGGDDVGDDSGAARAGEVGSTQQQIAQLRADLGAFVSLQNIRHRQTEQWQTAFMARYEADRQHDLEWQRQMMVMQSRLSQFSFGGSSSRSTDPSDAPPS